jgi:hypothetical protein
MWIERILIIWMTLSHDYLPSMWRLFQPTAWDWLTLIRSLGLFATMYLVFVRLVGVALNGLLQHGHVPPGRDQNIFSPFSRQRELVQDQSYPIIEPPHNI